jgi:hypothetical protein
VSVAIDEWEDWDRAVEDWQYGTRWG